MADKKKLLIKYFPASELVTFPGNPRKVKDPDAVKKLTKLIEAHGFQNPLNIWQHGGVNYILCGNHRFKAACDLGYTEFPCIVYTGTKEEALARVISDNKSSEFTEWDYPLLKDFVTQVDLGHLDIEITGFTAEELGGIFDYDSGVEPSGFPELPSGDKSPFQQVTFTLHDEQADTIQRALHAAKGMGAFIDSPNQNGNGNALARVCETFLTQNEG